MATTTKDISMTQFSKYLLIFIVIFLSQKKDEIFHTISSFISYLYIFKLTTYNRQISTTMNTRLLKLFRKEYIIKRVKLEPDIYLGINYAITVNGKARGKMRYTNRNYYSIDGTPYGMICDKPFEGSIEFTFIDFFYKEALIQREQFITHSYSFKVLKYRRELDRIRKENKGLTMISKLLKRIFIMKL